MNKKSKKERILSKDANVPVRVYIPKNITHIKCQRKLNNHPHYWKDGKR